MYLVTAEEMQQLDREAIENLGIPAASLMENAGRALAEEVLDYIRKHSLSRNGITKPWLILAGKGNNGGDGLVAARHMLLNGVDTEIGFAVSPDSMTGDAATQRDIVRNFQIPCFVYGVDPIPWFKYGGIVDALLGTGVRGAPREPFASLIREANANGLPVISADIPSGVDADNGSVHDPAIRAVRTVSFAFMKRGLSQYPAADQAGEIRVRSIGIPECLAERHPINCRGLELAELDRILPKSEEPLPQEYHPDASGLPSWLYRRQPVTHKGTYGHVLVVGGSHRYSGAGMLTAKASLRSGCGLTTWALPEKLGPAMTGKVPELILAAIAGRQGSEWTLKSAADIAELSKDKDVVIIGPGLGRFQDDSAWLNKLWHEIDAPLVIDADALNMLAGTTTSRSLTPRKSPVVVTPHPGEMARLTGLSIQEVQQNRFGVAEQFARNHSVTLVLKGARTVIATPSGRMYVNPTGNPGMATGGSGDVLAGIIGSLLAQGLNAEQAATLGVWLHGTAGDRAAGKRSFPGALLAGDIIDSL